MNDRPQSSVSDCKLLVFSESGQHHKSFVSVLRGLGLQNIPVTDNLAQAIQSIISQRFDLIIVTHVGAAKETTLLLEELGSHDATSDIPVVAVTQDGAVKQMLRIMAKGVFEVLVEPISQEMMEATIQKVLAGQAEKPGQGEGLEAADNFSAEGEYDLALPIYRMLLADPKLGFEAHMGMLAIAMAKKDWPQVEAMLKGASEIGKAADDPVVKHRELSEVFFRYGQYYQARSSLEKALKSFRTAYTLNPFHEDNMIALLGILQKENDLDAIVKLAHESAENYTPYSRPLEALAQNLQKVSGRFESLGMADQAHKLYAAMLDIKHQDPEVHKQAAQFFLNQGRPDLVVESLSKVTSRVKDPELLAMLGNVILDTPEDAQPALPPDQALDTAKEAFNHAMLLDPDEAGHRLGLAACELRAGNFDAAASVLEMLKAEPFGGGAIYTRVIDLLMEHQADELTAKWLKQGLELFPGDLELALKNARFMRQKGRYYDAVTFLKKALAKSGDHLELIKELAGVYLEMGQPSDAVFYYEKAVKLAPDDAQLKKSLQEAMLAE